MFRWLVATRRIGRGKDLNDVDIEIRWRLSRWWILTVIPFLTGHIFFPERPPHPRYTTIRAALNKKDSEAISTLNKLLKQLEERKVILQFVLDEIDNEGEYLDRHGIGRMEWMTPKALKSWVKPYHGKPDVSIYTRVLHPNLIREYKLHPRNETKGGAQIPQGRQAGQHMAGGPIVPGRGNQVAYTLEEFANKSLHIAEETGDSQVIGFRENREKDGGDKGSRLKQLRKDHPRMPDEDGNEWNKRINQLYKDKYDS